MNHLLEDAAFLAPSWVDAATVAGDEEAPALEDEPEEYSGPRKLDHQLSYSGGPGKG